MSKKRLTEDQALEYCMSQIAKEIITDPVEFNKLRQYKARYKKSELGEKAIATIFKRFGVKVICYYELDK